MLKLWPVVIAFWVTNSGAFAASPDFSLGGSFRSYPLSGVVEAEAGYGFTLWGTPETPWSGYIRPKIEAASALTYNSLAEVIEVFPLSILGVRAGGESIQNDTKYSAYNCEDSNCLGRFYRGFLEMELTLGYHDFFARGYYRRERWSQKASGQNFIEPTSGLIMNETGDAQTVFRYLVGYKYSEQSSWIGVFRLAQNNAHEKSNVWAILLDRKWSESLSITLGAGHFDSHEKPGDLMALGYFRWSLRPNSVGLPH